MPTKINQALSSKLEIFNLTIIIKKIQAITNFSNSRVDLEKSEFLFMFSPDMPVLPSNDFSVPQFTSSVFL